MRRVKTYCVTLDTDNPIGFCADKNRSVLRELNLQFVGRCLRGAYIVSINKVRRTSHCAITRADNSGQGSVNVEFDADTICVSAGDVIAGVKVLQNTQITVGVASNEIPYSKEEPAASPGNCVVSITPSTESKVLQVGQLACAVVVDRYHVHLSTQVSIVGSVARCNAENRVMQVQGSLKESVAKKLLPIVSEIEKELEFRRLEPAGVAFFEKLLHLQKTPPPEITLESRTGAAYIGFGSPVKLSAPLERKSSADDETAAAKSTAETKPAAEAKPDAAAKPSPANLSPAKPSPAKPSLAKPSEPKPSVAKPSVAKPSAAKPSVAKPSVAKPSAAKPSEANLSAAKPSAEAKPSLAKPSAAKSSAEAKPSAAKPSAEAKSSAADEIKVYHFPDFVRAAAAGGLHMDGYWYRPRDHSRSTPAALCASAEPSDLAVVDRIDPETAATKILHGELQALKLVRAMVVTYRTPELLNSHQNLWAAMRKSQAD